MEIRTVFCLYACLFLLFFGHTSAARGKHGNFMKQRKQIFKLCRDVTASNELQMSFECAERMKIPTLNDTHIQTKKFMGVRMLFNNFAIAASIYANTDMYT